MINRLHHIAIIASSEESIVFYTNLGFEEINRVERGYDTVVSMAGVCNLEIYIDPTHPKRMTNPEALGLRHLAFNVDNLDILTRIFNGEPVREDTEKRYMFIKDPDGLPIELCECK